MTDLKIIDELLVLMKPPSMSWKQFHNQYNIIATALNRLKKAWKSGKMPSITASLADYFRNPN